MEISYQFSALKVPVLRRNKATNSSTSTDPLSAATCIKEFIQVWKICRHIRTGILPLGIMKRIRRLSYFLHLYSQVANFPCECDVKSKNLWINYQAQGLSVQLKNRRLQVLELAALFLLKTETCDAKNSWEFFVDNIIYLVKIGFEKRGTNTK